MLRQLLIVGKIGQENERLRPRKLIRGAARYLELTPAIGTLRKSSYVQGKREKIQTGKCECLEQTKKLGQPRIGVTAEDSTHEEAIQPCR